MIIVAAAYNANGKMITVEFLDEEHEINVTGYTVKVFFLSPTHTRP